MTSRSWVDSRTPTSGYTNWNKSVDETTASSKYTTTSYLIMTSPSTSHQPTDSNGPTGKLCDWVDSITLDGIPEEFKTRAKYLILDGLACALIGAHLPWSERAAKAIFDMEPPGTATVFGWNRVSTSPPHPLPCPVTEKIQKISPIQAALLNGTFTQGFELDDWHSEAPLHSNSIILPTLFAAAEHVNKSDSTQMITGSDFLLATIVGYEVGPRVGNGLYGSHMLTMGWHSGAVFGPSASAAAASKLMHLPTDLIEDALGIACTQACGLMSAQYESEVKRMQHGFAARNGLLGALLARGKYVGIKRIFEREYGGFLAQFSLGNGKEPAYQTDEISKDLGEKWKIDGIRVKPYASMAGTHCTVDCMRALQKNYPEQMKHLKDITSITIEMGEVAYHHGGFKAERPLTATGAQMSAAYVAVTQMIDHEVLAAQFRHDKLERDEVWELVDKTICKQTEGFGSKWTQQITIAFKDNSTIFEKVLVQRGVDPPLSNEEVVEKWRALTKGVIDDKRRENIEELVLNLEDCKDIALLGELMAAETKNPIA